MAKFTTLASEDLAEPECHPSVATYMIKTFGEHYIDDENLIVTDYVVNSERSAA